MAREQETDELTRLVMGVFWTAASMFILLTAPKPVPILTEVGSVGLAVMGGYLCVTGLGAPTVSQLLQSD